MSDLTDRMRYHSATLDRALFIEAAARIEQLEAALRRCRTVLGNMAEENEGAIFNRWPINHEPLRNDAGHLLPIIDAALDTRQENDDVFPGFRGNNDSA